MPSNHFIHCYPLLFLPSIFPSIRSFPKSWLFASGGQNTAASVCPSNEYSVWISFRIDWVVLFAVQETLTSLLQHRSSNALILWHSAFFMVQLSYLYMTTGKTVALIRWTFIGKVLSLLLNMLSRLVIAFLFEEYSSAIKRNKLLIHATTWMILC